MAHVPTIYRATPHQPSIIIGYPPRATLIRRTIPRRLRPAAGILSALSISVIAWFLLIAALF